LINNENIDLEIIEVQTGVKVSEKDIIRYDDIYGRN
jgi:mannose-6-phosphate isomerase-like protein (cupin superfamily)